MVDYSLIQSLAVDEGEAEALLSEAFGGATDADFDMDSVLKDDLQDLKVGNILTGKVVGKAGDDAVIDVGLKSEGLVNKSEFESFEDLELGDKVEVVLEELEDESGVVKLSKRKADRIRGWERILESN
ncbi:MAG: S1 RNA-binding domain-containing protein, partial [Planctomycetota bacterium]